MQLVSRRPSTYCKSFTFEAFDAPSIDTKKSFWFYGWSFGAKYAGERTGVVFNNLMDDFSTPGQDNYFGFPASEANYIEPGKRPMSSMSPIIITDKDGKVKLVLGASGGSKIISSVSQVAARTLWTKKPMYEAINERRVHHQLYPFDLEIEKGFSPVSQTSAFKSARELRSLNRQCLVS